MNKNLTQIFVDIDFYNQYKSLSQRYTATTAMDNADKNRVVEIIENIGYKTKYISKGNFYKIEDNLSNWKVNIHFCLKYGMCEIILGGKNLISQEILGGPATLIYEDIEIYKGIQSESYIKDPSFSSYEELKEILTKALSIYEDFKTELLKYGYSL